jgi:hypothetical protein
MNRRDFVRLSSILGAGALLPIHNDLSAMLLNTKSKMATMAMFPAIFIIDTIRTLRSSKI